MLAEWSVIARYSYPARAAASAISSIEAVPVGGDRVAVQVAAQVAPLDERGQARAARAGAAASSSPRFSRSSGSM